MTVRKKPDGDEMVRARAHSPFTRLCIRAAVLKLPEPPPSLPAAAVRQFFKPVTTTPPPPPPFMLHTGLLLPPPLLSLFPDAGGTREAAWPTVHVGAGNASLSDNAVKATNNSAGGGGPCAWENYR